MAHVNHQTGGVRDQNKNSRGRGYMFCGRGMVDVAPCLILDLHANYVENMVMLL